MTLKDITVDKFWANDNQLVDWPFYKTPELLTHLYLQNNQLKTLTPTSPNHLRFLNVSGNQLKTFTNQQLKSLEVLDLSSNQFDYVPHEFDVMTPMLEVLILDRNNIDAIYGLSVQSLNHLSLSYLPLKTLTTQAFRSTSGEFKNDLTLTISHCPQLMKIEEETFMEMNIKSLDLSYNNFTSLPEKLVDWIEVTGEINLQGNPFDCSCSEQWMLDVILNKIYSNKKHQHLLLDLKYFNSRFMFV